MPDSLLDFLPSLDRDTIARRLAALVPPVLPPDPDLQRRISRLERGFSSFLSSAPVPLWAPRLAVTAGMRGQTEPYLQTASVLGAVRRVLRLAVLRTSFPASRLYGYSSWLDLLAELEPLVEEGNPARLLRRLLDDYRFRVSVLFSLAIPRRYGGSFHRYPRQYAFIEEWVKKREDRGETFRFLDAACGSGEGAWDLASLLSQFLSPESFRIDAWTVCPFELFAGAHAFFPHDKRREEAFRRRIGSLPAESASRIRFAVVDLCADVPQESFDLILCNGLLGGPLMHDDKPLREIVQTLGQRLRPGGMLLSCDRFHDGWKKKVPAEKLLHVFNAAGLSVVSPGEGIAGVRSGR